MMTMNVLIPRKEDAEDFVRKVSKFLYDVNLTRGHLAIDAKSIVGVLGLGIGTVLRVEANTDNLESMKDALQKYMVA